jgi:hypothetical protein
VKRARISRRAAASEVRAFEETAEEVAVSTTASERCEGFRGGYGANLHDS